MRRRRARECVLQALFQMEFTSQKPDAEWYASVAKGIDGAALEFINDIVGGVTRHRDEIDAAIKSASEHWVLDRMAAVDRNILRAAVYELIYRSDIPPAVTMNEAIEIAKKYSTSESASFINGLLDKIAKTVPGGRIGL